MTQLPDKLWLRRNEVRLYLGISRQAMAKLITAGVLKQKFFPGQAHAYYERTEVLKIQPETKNGETTNKHK